VLFNSYQFIFVFLPIALILYHLTPKEYKKITLIILSIYFYAQSNIKFLYLLLIMLSINYLLAKILQKYPTKLYLFITIIINLLPLIYYKYKLYETASNTIPLAISFYTFQLIAFQADIYNQKQKLTTLQDYLFFILFFPQLIAGPIVHFKQIIPQTKLKTFIKPTTNYINQAIILFSIGLFKKVILADNLAPISNKAFDHINQLDSLLAIKGLLAYTLQIYFDFSAYSDMALALALLFGIKLPINFYSPYKATNIVEFWRKWHITLSNFLRDYIYIPLGGSKKSHIRTIINLLTTMIIGGLWHGFGLNFMLWGFLHGLLLTFNHTIKFKFLPKIVSILLTFTSVSLLWVLFRANSLQDALIYYQTLFSPNYQLLITLIKDTQLIIILFITLTLFILPNSIEYSKFQAKNPTFKKSQAILSAFMLFLSLKMLASNPPQEFVYFNF